MPFSMAAAGVGGRFFPLTLTLEDLSSTYDIEAEVVSNFGVSTKAGDIIRVTVSAVDVVAATTSGYAIDGNGLDNDARLEIIFTASSYVSGRGGVAGNGGVGSWDQELGIDLSSVGANGNNGGTAIRYGCPTTLSGAGDIIKGYGAGGGGGGGAISNSTEHGGGGGGGGAALGTGGAGGAGSDGTGVAGGTATVTADGGAGAAGGAQAGAGGRGGDSAAAAANGASGTKAGGTAGTDGNAIDTQGFSHTTSGVTITGAVV